MLGNVGQGRRDDDATRLLVVERDGLLVLEGGHCPVVQCQVELFARLARCLDDLLIGERLVLVECEPFGEVGGGIEPLLAIALLGILLQVGSLHDLCVCFECAAKDNGCQQGDNRLLHNSLTVDVVKRTCK